MFVEHTHWWITGWQAANIALQGITHQPDTPGRSRVTVTVTDNSTIHAGGGQTVGIHKKSHTQAFWVTSIHAVKQRYLQANHKVFKQK